MRGPWENSQTMPKKVVRHQGPEKTLAQMALSPNYYALKRQRSEKILAQKSARKMP